MKRSKKIWVLLVVLALCCAATLAVSQIQEKQEQIQNSEAVILSISEDAVEKLSWSTETTDLAFYRDENGSWTYYNDPSFPVDNEILASMLGLFEEFSVTFVIEAVEDFAQYGLDEPICTIAFSTEDTAYTLQLGDFSKMDEQRYISIGDGNVYLVSMDPLDTYDAELRDVIDHDDIPVFGTVDRISFAGAESYTLTYLEDAQASYCPEDVYYWDSAPADTDNVAYYLDNLTYLDMTDYVTYNVTDGELDAYGLSDPELTVSIDYTVENDDESTTANTFTIQVGLVTEEAEEADAEPVTTAYARVGTSSIIYRLADDDRAAILACSYNDLRHADLFTASFETVIGMDITLDGITYGFAASIITDEASGEESVSWNYGEAEIDIADIEYALTTLWADGFSSEAPTGKEEISLVIHLENDYADTMEIAFYRIDGKSCLCRINGESVSVFSRSDVVDLIEAVNAIVLN